MPLSHYSLAPHPVWSWILLAWACPNQPLLAPDLGLSCDGPAWADPHRFLLLLHSLFLLLHDLLLHGLPLHHQTIHPRCLTRHFYQPLARHSARLVPCTKPDGSRVRLSLTRAMSRERQCAFRLRRHRFSRCSSSRWEWQWCRVGAFEEQQGIAVQARLPHPSSFPPIIVTVWDQKWKASWRVVSILIDLTIKYIIYTPFRRVT